MKIGRICTTSLICFAFNSEIIFPTIKVKDSDLVQNENKFDIGNPSMEGGEIKCCNCRRLFLHFYLNLLVITYITYVYICMCLIYCYLCNTIYGEASALLYGEEQSF